MKPRCQSATAQEGCATALTQSGQVLSLSTTLHRRFEIGVVQVAEHLTSVKMPHRRSYRCRCFSALGETPIMMKRPPHHR